jgi:hypothetical protein
MENVSKVLQMQKPPLPDLAFYVWMSQAQYRRRSREVQRVENLLAIWLLSAAFMGWHTHSMSMISTRQHRQRSAQSASWPIMMFRACSGTSLHNRRQTMRQPQGTKRA